ncbi:MAG TPA: histidine phosphatase family protein [Candidatus Atribacteria bacterium]|mgnify:CR=1 FL=1|nr:histidine phosphatase family protein [Candidatus Atribacteria bacterium]HPT78155.1 histidine phosphatase family protein [Candidatus Atribacteria bacterium]
MEVYLIRHGESEGNVLGVFQGWADYGLSERGRTQALMAKARLKGVRLDRIYASDTARAAETAGLVFPDDKGRILFTRELRETGCGCLDELTPAQAEGRYGSLYSEREDGWDFRPFGGEHACDMEKRVVGFLKALEAECPGMERIAVVTHFGPIAAMLAYVLKADFRTVCSRLELYNCSISIIKHGGSGWRVAAVNIADHLG